LEWIRRQPKARGTKAKARIDSFDKLQEKANQKIEIIEPVFDIKMNRIGGKIFEIKNVTHRFGNQIILKNFSYTFKPKDRIGIIGKNGIGKSTFLNLLSGIEIPQAGSIIPGETVVLGYYRQQGLSFNENARVLDVITGIAEAIPVNKGESITASQLLGRFGFPVAMQHSPVRKLSGGEKRRLYLLTVLMRNPNVLLLDEPTNDLDLLTLQLLEAFLVEYEGSLVVVSHDRYFMDRLVEHLFIFEGQGIIQDFPGNYSQYREKMMQQLTAAALKPETKQTKNTNDKAQQAQTGKLSSKERKRYELLEQEIEKAEAQKITLTNQLSNGEIHHTELLNISQQIQTIQQTIDKLTEEWLILAERI
jgi:ATP-binding cassette subfamily F protein uup